MNIDKVREEARNLLVKFGSDLGKVEIGKRSSHSEDGLTFRKEEEEGRKCDEEFKTIMFKNAPSKDDSYLLLGKAHWN